MPRLTAIDSEYINDRLTWFSEGSDTEGVHLRDEVRCDSLPGKPLVLFAFRDFKLVKPENCSKHDCSSIGHKFETAVGSLGLRGSDSHNRASLIKFCEQLRDSRLAARLAKSGGVFTVLGDSRQAFVVLLWVGKTAKDLRKELDDIRKSALRGQAAQKIQEALREALEVLGQEATRSVVDEILNK